MLKEMLFVNISLKFNLDFIIKFKVEDEIGWGLLPDNRLVEYLFDINELLFHFQEHLMDFIVRQKGFWADDDDLVLKAIHEGFIQTHYAMWKELGQYLL